MMHPTNRLAGRIGTRLSRSFQPPLRSFTTTRPYTANGGGTASKKDAIMDKDAMNTSSNEYSKTGEGDAGAAHTSKAFDPGDTSPEGQHGGVKNEAGDANPLEVSPGNHEANKPFMRNESERSTAETKGERKGASGPQGEGGVKGSGMGKK